MYVIVVYDVNESIVNKVKKICRIYLNHIQNSVFEGEISESKFMKLRNLIEITIDKNKDSIIIFKMRSNSEIKKEIIGLEKNNIKNII